MVNPEEKKEQKFIIPESVFDHKELSKFDLKIYGNIENLTHNDGYCYASGWYLTNKVHSCRKTVQRALNKLEKLGFIIIEKEGRKQKISLPTQTQCEIAEKPTPQTQDFDIGKVLTLVDNINAKQKEKYLGYDPVKYCEKPFGVQLRLIIFTLAKAYFSHEFLGITLANRIVTDDLLQNLIEVFDIEFVHGLAHYLVDHFEEVEDVDRYILTGIINGHNRQLKSLGRQT